MSTLWCKDYTEENLPPSADDKRSMKERMLAGDWYKLTAGDPATAELRADWELSKARSATFSAEGLYKGPEGRYPMLKEMFGNIGNDSDIYPPFYCAFGYNINLGASSFFNFNCVVIDSVRVDIGDNTLIGPGVQLLTVEHPRNAAKRLEGWESGRPISIGSNVWIGGGAIVLPGVSIGDNAIVGAGAVVTRDVAEGTTVVGNPAKPIRNKWK